MRLFVAIGIPERLAPLLNTLQSGVPGARWVKPENFHLTLAFIGEVDGGLAQDIDTALLRIHGHKFEISLAGVGHFSDGNFARALYVPAGDNPALAGLQQKIDGALTRIGVRRDRKKYLPHVTLARFANKTETGHHFAQFLASHSLFKCPPFTVETFALYSSMVGKAGSIYRVEADYPLL